MKNWHRGAAILFLFGSLAAQNLKPSFNPEPRKAE
jgi:hypothetical protein